MKRTQRKPLLHRDIVAPPVMARHSPRFVRLWGLMVNQPRNYGRRLTDAELMRLTRPPATNPDPKESAP